MRRPSEIPSFPNRRRHKVRPCSQREFLRPLHFPPSFANRVRQCGRDKLEAPCSSFSPISRGHRDRAYAAGIERRDSRSFHFATGSYVLNVLLAFSVLSLSLKVPLQLTIHHPRSGRRQLSSCLQQPFCSP